MVPHKETENSGYNRCVFIVIHWSSYPYFWIQLCSSIGYIVMYIMPATDADYFIFIYFCFYFTLIICNATYDDKKYIIIYIHYLLNNKYILYYLYLYL